MKLLILMNSEATPGKSRDMLSTAWSAVLLFWLPAVAIAVTANPAFDSDRTIVWTVALTTMGAACVANALRCGRVHCYMTGPFFLLTAAITVLYGVGILPLGHNGWSYIGLAILVGAIALRCLPEMLWGKYRRS